MKEAPKHNDILGQPLQEGNYVAISRRNCMKICSIIKISPKQIRVVPIKKSEAARKTDGWLVYPSETVLLSGPDALAYILKNI